jgi:hypothetical protein
MLPTKKTIASYFPATVTSDIPAMLLDYLASYIYSIKMGERLYVHDSIGLLGTLYKYNPQISYLKVQPEGGSPLRASDAKGILARVKQTDIQKYAASLFDYTPEFNRAVVDTLARSQVKSLFDIGVHVVSDDPAVIKATVDLVTAYAKKKAKKGSLLVFVMAPNAAAVAAFQKAGDPTWIVTSLQKVAPKDADEAFIRQMAEVQVLSVQTALVLDFTQSIDRYTYLMHRNLKEMEYLKTTNSTTWTLL